MPDSRRHRGKAPKDALLFGDEARLALTCAGRDLAWLLGRAYPIDASLKLVGDRYGLVQRQRKALLRAACEPERATARIARRVSIEQAAGAELWIDGFNVLTTIEVALAGGVVLFTRDGCARDIAGVHGSYRRVDETLPALELLGECLARWEIASSRWLLDRPVSNSGRLCTAMRELAAERGYRWIVELVADPDPLLSATEELVATADGVILDASAAWLSLAREVIERSLPDSFVVDLGD